MNKFIKAITSLMIIILIIALVWIFLSYYKNNGAIDTIIFPNTDPNVSTLNNPSGDDISNEDFITNTNLVDSIINKSSGDVEQLTNKNNTSNYNNSDNEENNSSEIEISGEFSKETENNNTEIENEKSGESLPNTIIEIPTKEENSEQLVIFSDPETSNQEKQEILTEIDEALKGLLEAVGKVEVVDEDRLNATLDSEVNRP